MGHMKLKGPILFKQGMSESCMIPQGGTGIP